MLFQQNTNKTIVANWKMNPSSYEQAVSLLDLYINNINNNQINLNNFNLIIAIPAVYLHGIYLKLQALKLKNFSNIHLSAQNICWEPTGAFTGEVAASSVKSVGCELVILGHSERRIYNHETDALIAKKFLMAINSGLTPIVCIGETQEEFNNKQTWQVLDRQLEFLQNFNQNSNNLEFFVAYEPVWAIGTGITADEAYIAEVLNYLKIKLNQFNLKHTKLLYGGSVTEHNAKNLFNLANLDGALIGGASLDINKFTKICCLT